MTATQLLPILADVVAVGVLTFGIYFPRHHRRDLVLSYIGINVGVLAVATALATGTVTAGLGLGLFGVLSIIRLRSAELDQHEVAYYFAALALGLLGGLATAASTVALPLVLMALVVGAMYLAGHPRLLGRTRRQVMLLDAAYTDEVALVAHLERLLGATVHQAEPVKVDLVNETTLVDVRFSLRRNAAVAPSTRVAA